MGVMRYEVEIGELVLVGIDPPDRNALAESLERDLARALAREGIPRQVGSGYSVDIVQSRIASRLLASGAGSAALVDGIGGAIHAALGARQSARKRQ